MARSGTVLKNMFFNIMLMILLLVCIDTTIGQTIQTEGFLNSKIDYSRTGEIKFSKVAQTRAQPANNQETFYLFPATGSCYEAISMPDNTFCQSMWQTYCRNETIQISGTDLRIKYVPKGILGVRFENKDTLKLYYELFHKSRNNIQIPSYVKYHIMQMTSDKPHKQKKRNILIANPVTRSFWKDVDSILRLFVRKGSRHRHRSQ